MIPGGLCRDIRREENLALHTSFRTGGPAQFLALPADETELLALLDWAEQQSFPHCVIGRGTNLLAADEGCRGLVIKLEYGEAAMEDGFLQAPAGISLARLCEAALANGLGGLEFAAGIPGSLGGAIVMNAGAYGGEINDVIHSVRWREPGGQIRETPAAELGFSYRTSRFHDNPGVILSARLRLQAGSPEQSRRLQNELMERRRSRQPLDLPSAGSTFKRPPGSFAGPLIEMCGLKGARVGGAAVSRKHAGFVVNTGGAASADVRRLIAEVQRAVYAATGVLLEPEVQFLGDFSD